MSRLSTERKQRLILAFCLIGGVLLTVIGIRYLLTPESAARTFGVPGRPEGYELYYIIGLRNVWLGLLAVAFRGLARMAGAGAVVCPGRNRVFRRRVDCGKLDRPVAAGRISHRLRLGLHRAGGRLLAIGETSELTR